MVTRIIIGIGDPNGSESVRWEEYDLHPASIVWHPAALQVKAFHNLAFRMNMMKSWLFPNRVRKLARGSLKSVCATHVFICNETRSSCRAATPSASGCDIRIHQGHFRISHRSERDFASAQRCLGDRREFVGAAAHQHRPA